MKDGQQIVKCFAGDDPAVEESDDVAGDAGGDERSFAYALDALAEEEGEDCGQGDYSDVEADFEFSEFPVVTLGSIFYEGFGTHHSHPGLDFEHDADGLHDTSGQEQGDRQSITARM